MVVKKKPIKKEDARHKNMGRPEKEIDWKLVDELLISGCPGTEIAPHFDMHPTTFSERVFKQYNMTLTAYSLEKRKQGDNILRHTQFLKATGKTAAGDNTLLIWLGKNRLGQRETLDKSDMAPNDKAINELITHLKSQSGLPIAAKSETNTEL